jgi:hypothetical protein
VRFECDKSNSVHIEEETTVHRVLFATYRKEGLSSEEFVDHYRKSHIPTEAVR